MRNKTWNIVTVLICPKKIYKNKLFWRGVKHMPLLFIFTWSFCHLKLTHSWTRVTSFTVSKSFRVQKLQYSITHEEVLLKYIFLSKCNWPASGYHQNSALSSTSVLQCRLATHLALCSCHDRTLSACPPCQVWANFFTEGPHWVVTFARGQASSTLWVVKPIQNELSSP